jgi:hypothetical protein
MRVLLCINLSGKVMTVRTRFAPSPTGYLHIGGARTALFSWAYARKHGGTFILRIEDTDVERSTPEAVQAILDGMNWLNLNYDEGPFYQMQRMPRYKEVIQQMLDAGQAYLCYTAPAELDALREAQRARGEKPRYDGRWRPEPGKTLPAIPADVKPVVRFKNPISGVVTWKDMVKGQIEFSNAELDDLIIARSDGTPTYNFCVVVDDWDMGITQVIRGESPRLPAHHRGNGCLWWRQAVSEREQWSCHVAPAAPSANRPDRPAHCGVACSRSGLLHGHTHQTRGTSPAARRNPANGVQHTIRQRGSGLA